VRRPAAFVVLIAAALTACGSQGSHRTVKSAGHPCHGATAPSWYRHVVLVALENHDYDEVSVQSPYLDELGQECGVTANYHAITHPSLPNYLALTAGTTAGISDDCTHCQAKVASIFQQLGGDWRTYAEAMPSPGFQGPFSQDYAKKHNPAAYFPALAAQYARNDLPLTPAAVRTLGRFTLIVPDLCHDEHDCSLDTGDRWLQQWLPRILRSPAYRSGDTALFVTYDEGVGSDEHVYMVVAAPSVRPGSVSNERFDHYSLLRTIEELLGLPCLANACTASSMAAPLHLLAP
jgi:hypothetical protein